VGAYVGMLYLPDGSHDFDSRDEKTGVTDGLIGVVVEVPDVGDAGSDDLGRRYRT
jgi:hypothetical protein